MSSDGAEDLVPSMRSVQLSDDDKHLMAAFKDKVDDSGQYRGEGRSLYRGGHIPSRLFRQLDNTVSGGAPANARIGGPGQNRTVQVHMQPGGANGQQVHPSQQEVPEPKKYTGGNIPSRSFRVLQQMTAGDEQGPPLQLGDSAAPRSPSHYARGHHQGLYDSPSGSTTVTAGGVPTSGVPTHGSTHGSAHIPAHGSAPPSDWVPTCERLERQAAVAPAPVQPRRVMSAPREAVPSRAFRQLQSEYDGPKSAPVVLEVPVVPVVPVVPCPVLVEAEQREKERQRLAATSKTYRLLQTDPAMVPSVLGRGRR